MTSFEFDDELYAAIRMYCEKKKRPVVDFIEGTLWFALQFSEGIEVPESYRKDEIADLERKALKSAEAGVCLGRTHAFQYLSKLADLEVGELSAHLRVDQSILRQELFQAFANARIKHLSAQGCLVDEQGRKIECL